MEFVEAPILKDTYSCKQLLEHGYWRKMGSIMRQMHKCEAKGYGAYNKETQSGRYTSFTEFNQAFMKGDRFKFLLKNQYINSRFKKILESREQIVVTDIEKNKTVSVLFHIDYGPRNIFSTKPLTIFDPDPAVNHPMYDVAYALVKASSMCSDSIKAVNSQFIEGYFDGEEYSLITLEACIVLNAVRKLYIWHNKNDNDRIKTLHKYLSSLTIYKWESKVVKYMKQDSGRTKGD